MRNTYVLVFAFIAIILSGCTVIKDRLQPSPTPTDSVQVGTAVVGTPAPTPTEIEGSLFSLLNSGDKKCTWATTTEGNRVDGTAYVSGAKVRAELQTRVSLLPVTAYAVGDGKTLTAWVSALPSKKFTFSYAEVEGFIQEATASGTKNVPSSKEIEQFLQNNTFRCETWTVEPNKFVVE